MDKIDELVETACGVQVVKMEVLRQVVKMDLLRNVCMLIVRSRSTKRQPSSARV